MILQAIFVIHAFLNLSNGIYQILLNYENNLHDILPTYIIYVGYSPFSNMVRRHGNISKNTIMRLSKLKRYIKGSSVSFNHA